MNRKHIRKFTLAPFGVAALLAVVAQSAYAQSVTYSGEAAVIQGEVSLTGGTLIGPIQVNVVSAGPLPAVGGSATSSLANIGVSALQQIDVAGKVASASTVGGPSTNVGVGKVVSKASVTNVRAGVGVLLPTLTVTADAVTSESSASCNGQLSATLQGKSNITKLAVNGISIRVTGQPNQFVRVSPIAALMINEQIKNAADGTIETNAIRLTLSEPGTLLNAEVVVGAQVTPLLSLSAQVLAQIAIKKLVTGDVLVGHSEAGVDC